MKFSFLGMSVSFLKYNDKTAIESRISFKTKFLTIKSVLFFFSKKRKNGNNGKWEFKNDGFWEEKIYIKHIKNKKIIHNKRLFHLKKKTPPTFAEDASF